MCAELGGSKRGKRGDWHVGWPPDVFLSEREFGGWQLQSPFHIPKRTWMYWNAHWWTRILQFWAPEVAGTTPGKSQILCFAFFLFVRENCLPHGADIIMGWKHWDLGGLVNVIMSTKPLVLLGRKFKVFLLLMLVFRFPWTLRTHLCDYFMRRLVEKQD